MSNTAAGAALLVVQWVVGYSSRMPRRVASTPDSSCSCNRKTGQWAMEVCRERVQQPTKAARPCWAVHGFVHRPPYPQCPVLMCCPQEAPDNPCEPCRGGAVRCSAANHCGTPGRRIEGSTPPTVSRQPAVFFHFAISQWHSLAGHLYYSTKHSTQHTAHSRQPAACSLQPTAMASFPIRIGRTSAARRPGWHGCLSD